MGARYHTTLELFETIVNNIELIKQHNNNGKSRKDKGTSEENRLTEHIKYDILF